MKKIIFSLLLLVVIIINNIYFGAEITINDAKWNWSETKGSFTNTHSRELIANYLKQDPHVKEYIDRCSVSDIGLTLTDNIFEYLNSIKVVEDSTEVIKLKDILAGLYSPDKSSNKIDSVESELLLKLLINKYDMLFAAGSNTETSALFSKSQFEELIKEKDEATKAELRESFSTIYFVQNNIEKYRGILKTYVENDEYQRDDLTGKSEDWGYYIKDKYVFLLIKEMLKNGISISKKTSYDKLANTVSINTSSNYDASYVYFFADAEDIEEFNTAYNLVNSIESPDVYYDLYDAWDEQKYEVTNVQYNLNIEAGSDVFNLLEQEQFIVAASNTSYKNYTVDSLIEDIVQNRIDIASYMDKAHLGTEESLAGNRPSDITSAINNADDGLYTFQNKLEKQSFFKTTKTKTYTLELTNGDNALSTAFKSYTCPVYYGAEYIVLRGTLKKNGKAYAFTLDETSEDVYYLQISGQYGPSDYLLEPTEIWEVDGKDYIEISNSESYRINSVKVKATTGKYNVKIEPTNVYYFEEELYKNLETYDLYYDLLSYVTGLKEDQKTMQELLKEVAKASDYSGITKTESQKILNSTTWNYDQLKLCPDEVDVSGICKDDWWGCAFDFLDKGQNSGVNPGIPGMLSELRELVFDIGNIIFIVVTAFLGVKYIWGGVDSKYSVKNSLVTLVIAAIVFYGWNAVTDILNVKELLTGSNSANGYENFATTIYNTIMYIVNVAAIGGIIYIGIKYMMAGADGKAEMKLKLIPVIMGIIMVYGTLNLINFILDIVYTF